MNELEINNKVFENIKHIDKFGNEYWLARELMKALKYSEYRKFVPIINKAITSCKQSNQNISDHFAHVSEMVHIGSKATREIEEYKLSRYACYLIAQNADNRKKVVSLAQTYFAVQTRKQEILEEEFSNLYSHYSYKQWGRMPSQEGLNRVKARDNNSLYFFKDKIILLY